MPPRAGVVLLLACATACATTSATATAASAAGPKTVRVHVGDDHVVLDNGYVRAAFNTAHPGLDYLAGDFAGKGAYATGSTLSSGGLVLQSLRPDGTFASSSADGAGAALHVSVPRNDTTGVTVVVAGIVDSVASTGATETWTLSLDAGARGLTLDMAGGVAAAATSASTTAAAAAAAATAPALVAVMHGAYMRAASVYGFYDVGPVQMMGAPAGAQCYSSAGRLHRVYSLGGAGNRRNNGTSLDVLRRVEAPGLAWGSNQTVLVGGAGAPGAGGGDTLTGVQEVVFGSADAAAMKSMSWAKCWGSHTPAPVPAGGASWHTSSVLHPNEYDFPASGLPPSTPNMDVYDLRAHQTGIMGSPAGQFDAGVGLPGQIGTSLFHPTQSYTGNFNFFDPDSFISTSALMYSGDRYLLDTMRACVERSGSKMLASGQIPHHFVGQVPTYTALSGATQTGPNIFWLEAAIMIARHDDDSAWVSSYLPTLRRALEFLLNLADPAHGHMLLAPGSLWIDVFRRSNFTSDSNPMMVKLLRDFADVEHAVGNATNGARLEGIAVSIARAVDASLWDTASDDHYVTQLNPDGSTVDMVDYDSNMLCIAWGVAPLDRAARALTRMDGGHCMQLGIAQPTYVSEKWYGPDMCYKANVGDSATSMGRIAWADAHARRRVGDNDAFSHRVLLPLQEHLLNMTWMYERFGCLGQIQTNRSYTYFEYPAVVAILLREVKYGIELTLRNVTVDPFTPAHPRSNSHGAAPASPTPSAAAAAPVTSTAAAAAAAPHAAEVVPVGGAAGQAGPFSYHIGRVAVDYAADKVRISVPGAGRRGYRITGLTPSTKYALTATGCAAPAPPAAVVTDASGTASFEAAVGTQCAVTLAT